MAQNPPRGPSDPGWLKSRINPHLSNDTTDVNADMLSDMATGNMTTDQAIDRILLEAVENAEAHGKIENTFVLTTMVLSVITNSYLNFTDEFITSRCREIVKDWTRLRPLAHADFVATPAFVGGNHWVTYLIPRPFVPAGEEVPPGLESVPFAYVIDSFGSTDLTPHLKRLAALKIFFIEYARANADRVRYAGKDRKAIMLQVPTEARQKDGTSCGIFACLYISETLLYPALRNMLARGQYELVPRGTDTPLMRSRFIFYNETIAVDMARAAKLRAHLAISWAGAPSLRQSDPAPSSQTNKK